MTKYNGPIRVKIQTPETPPHTVAVGTIMIGIALLFSLTVVFCLKLLAQAFDGSQNFLLNIKYRFSKYGLLNLKKKEYLVNRQF